MRAQHLRDGTEGTAVELAGNGVGAIEIGIDNAYQSNRLALLFKFFVDASVIASEDTHAHHCDGNRIVRGQERVSLGQVAGEQRIVNGKREKRLSNLVIG